MAQTFVQGAHNETGGAVASLARAFTSNNAANNLLVYTVVWERSAPNPTFGDSAGNTIVDSGNGITDQVIGAFKVQTVVVLAAKAGANTFTASWGAPNPAFSGITISEFHDSVNTGGWTIDKIAATTGNSTNPASGNTAATTNANEVVFGWVGNDGGADTQGTGFTAGPNNIPTLEDFSEYKFVTSTGAQNAVFANATIGDWAAQCTTFFANAAGAAAPTIGWSRPSDPERPRPILLQADARQAFVPLFVTAKTPSNWFRAARDDPERLPPISLPPDEPKQWFVRSPVPVPTGFYPPTTGADRERIFPIPRSPDEATPFFVRSPVPVPARWVPTTGQEDRPPNPNRIRAPDEPFPWFVRSPSPVPITWLPQWDGWERPKRIDLDPSSTAFSFRAVTVQSTIAGMAWWRPADDARLVSGRGVRPPDEATPWFVRSPNPVPTTWLPTTGEEDRPPNPNRIRAPDEPFPWFVQSPSPVPATWLPTAGEHERLPPVGRSPDEAIPYFQRSLVPVPITWLPTAHTDGDYPPPVKFEDRIPSFAPKPPAAPVGISGMAWFMPPEQIPRFDVTITDQHWSPAWAPQIIIQLAPTTKPEWIIRARRRARR